MLEHETITPAALLDAMKKLASDPMVRLPRKALLHRIKRLEEQLDN